VYTPNPAMAAFYLNVRDGDALIRDPQPYFFATAQDARDAAVKALRRMIADDGVESVDDRQIEIADETGHPIAVVHRYDAMPARYH
jgi:hypothetical protein